MISEIITELTTIKKTCKGASPCMGKEDRDLNITDSYASHYTGKWVT